MKIDIRSSKSVYVTIGEKTFYIDDATDEAICEVYEKEKSNCTNCGSVLGMYCGDAEPDFNENFCSLGCFVEFKN